jgi:hypothetical protein
MRLLQWATNDAGLRRYLLANYPDDCADEETSILGYTWNTTRDTLQFRGPSDEALNFSGPLTRRKLFSVTASTYDLIGFMSPLTLAMKLLVQETFLDETKPGWNDTLNDYFQEAYQAYLPDVIAIGNIILPRCKIYSPKAKEATLHFFSDASVQAYAVCVYLVTSHTGEYEGEANSRLIFAKQRLSPTKTSKDQELTIPRLELTALWMSFRAAVFLTSNGLQTESPVTKLVFWCDSQPVLFWLKALTHPGVYVRNRVHHILGLAEKLNVNYDLSINYIPTAHNPADLATRPHSITPIEMADPNCWWYTGPDFLTDKHYTPRN